MTTTALFVELLVGGVQTLVWVTLLTLACCGPDHIEGIIAQQSLGSGVILILLAYAIGVVFDRLWDLVLKPIDRMIRKRIAPEPGRVDRIRALLFSKDETKVSFVEYIRSRMRIARATVCNSVMIAVSAFTVRTAHHHEPCTSWMACLAVFALVLFLLSLYAYIDTTKGYYKTLCRFEPYLRNSQPEGPDDLPKAGPSANT